MSCKLEPVIRSSDTGQWIPCFDRCQLIITLMSIIKEVHSEPRLHISVKLLFVVWPPCSVTPSPSPSCVRNTASHSNHEKINSWVSFCFPYEYEDLLGGPSGRQSSAKTIFFAFSNILDGCSNVFFSGIHAVRNIAIIFSEKFSLSFSGSIVAT